MRVLLFLTLLVLLSSCSKDDGGGTTTTTTELTGNITSNKTISGNITLKGIVQISNGATLTISPGTVITSNPTTGTNGIVVMKDGKLMAEGTAANPIVMTTTSKTPGDWLGITIIGEAPILASGGATTSNTEGSVVTTYGGTNSAHNSGSLKYVRVEYAGKKVADGSSENNGFSFYAVGSGTTLDHLVAYKGTDDGFEFYGGTVNATNLISYGNFDDSFDWQDGWRGTGSNWFAYQTGTANFGMEIEASNNVNTFGPTVSGVTLKRAANTNTESGVTGAGSEWHAIQFKKGGNGEYTNIKAVGYNNTDQFGIVIQDTKTEDVIRNNTLNVTGSFDSNPVVRLVVANSTITIGDFYTANAAATGASITKGTSWSMIDGFDLLSNL